jgi:hypothetical protein
MPEFLKGNYKVDAKIEDKGDAADSTDEFEKKALSRLGGSICFVSKKSLMWTGEPQPKARRADTEDGTAKARPAGGAAIAGGAAAAGEATEMKDRTAKAHQDARAGVEKPDGTGKKDRPRA